MSKICPNCKYPNLDKAEVCFKCGADISAETIRETQARERREARQAQAQQRENAHRQRNEEMEQRATFQEEMNAERENQEILLRRRYLAGNMLQRLWADDLSNNPNWTLKQIKLLLKIWDIVCIICFTVVILFLLIFSIISVISAFNRNNNDSVNNNSNITTEENMPVPNNIMPYGSDLPNRINNYGGY